MKLKINLVGAGNVAWHICNALSNLDYDIKQVYSRTFESAQKLASTFGFKAVKNTKDFDEVNAIILAVDDNQIEAASNALDNPFDAVVIHTSGSISIDVLQKHKNAAVFWMIQSLKTGEKINYSNVPIIVHYSNGYASNLVHEIATTISSKAHILADTERRKMHLSAVMANNFTNHLFALLKQYTENNQLDFNLLQPIIQSTVTNAVNNNPMQLQTGPAIRRDHKTTQAHLKLLENDKAIAEIYEAITNSIQKTHKQL